ncbi:MAG: ferritin family protein [Oscillospiraceae bacterium]|nr:ferritin family protein [Oscillospiraceae bacterium]
MDGTKMSCELSIPYPPVRTDGKNLYFASLLTNDYAGTVSEMSAVTAYSFQHLVTYNQKISETVRCISIVEMRHFEMIGRLITQFGGNPRVAVQSGCKCAFWSAQYVSYESNPKLYLKDNITNEKAAIASYYNRINQISDRTAQELLKRIILDEENHIRLFNELIEEFY